MSLDLKANDRTNLENPSFKKNPLEKQRRSPFPAMPTAKCMRSPRGRPITVEVFHPFPLRLLIEQTKSPSSKPWLGELK